MPQERKTEAELLQEMDLLRRRVCELEQQLADRKVAEQGTANLAKLPAEDPNPVLRISTDCTILYANDASSIVLQTWQRQVGQALPEPCCQRAKEALSSGKVSTFEFNCVDGRIFLVTLAPVAQEGYLNAYGVDITERKKAQDALLDSESKYRDLVEEMTDIIYTVDAQGILTSVNKAVKGVSGHDAAEVIGRHFTSLLMPDYIPEAKAAFERVLGGESVIMETTALDNSAKQLHVEVSSIPIIKDGVVVGARGIIRDITQRKNAEYELQESHKKYRHLVDNITDGVYQIDTKGNFTYVNKVIEERSGIPAEKFVGLNFRDVVIPEYHEIVGTNLARFWAGEQVPPFELAYRTATGQTVTVETNVRPIYDGNTITGVQGISRDITQRKKAEKKLRESETTLRSIIDSITESVLLVEPDETVLIANRTLAERLGTTIEGLIGKCAYDFMPPDLAASRKQQIEKVVRTGGPVIFEDMRGDRHILNSVNPINDSTGKVVRIAIFGLDVTHLVEIQEALRESELRYRSLFEGSPVGLGLSTTDGKILDCNSTMLGMIGYSIGEIGQVNLKDTYVNLQARARLLKELATNGLVRDFEVRLRRKDGTAYWASLSVIPFPFAGPNTMLAAQVDITERKQVEEYLRDARNILRRIIDMLPVRVFWKNKDLKYLGANEAFVKDAGLELVDEIVGKNDFDLVWKNQAELFRAGDKEVIETGRPKLTYEEPSTAPSGDAIWVNTSKIPLKNAEGETIGVLGVYSDITAQKQMHDALRQSENKYRTLLENLPQRVFLKDKNSVYISCNESYARDLGIKADQIAGRTDYDFYPKELAEKYKADDRRVVESGQTIDIEEKYILEGQEFIVHTVKTPVADEQGNVIGMLGIFWDITDSKRRERELNLYHEKITQTERLASLGTLSATVAHELTQPLTTIRLSIENSLVDLEGTSCLADALDGLKDGLEGVEYAVAIIDRFRNFARQSSDKAITEVELKEVAERILRLLDKNAQQADISLQLKDLERLPPIYANEKDMEQLFFAIVDNAIHVAVGKKKRQLTISGVVKGEHVELRFADNCGGIAPENVDKIFEPFFTTRPAGEGTGLGLPIVRHIVSRAGGKVWVQNYPGKGATFLVNLPTGKDMGS